VDVLSKYIRGLGVLLAVASLCASSAARAQGFGVPGAAGKSVTLNVLPEKTAVSADSSMDVVLEFEMAKDWHTYWQYAGPDDTGFPPEIEWSLPEGVMAGKIEFATPERFVTEIPGLGDSINYGYSHVVRHVVKLEIAGSAKAGDHIIGGTANWLACKEGLCLPGDASFSFELKIGDVAAPHVDNAGIAVRARGQLPSVPADWNFVAVRNGNDVELTGNGGKPPKGLRFFPMKKGMIDEVAKQKYDAADTGWTLTIPGVAETVDTIHGLVVPEGDWEGWGTSSPSALVQAKIGAGAGPTEATQSADSEIPDATATDGAVATDEKPPITLAFAVLLAFGGGMILNLMPCVLPVLSIKIFDFVKQGDEGKSSPLLHGSTFAAGVLVSFWALAGVLLGLQAGGEALGWGFQMQSPVFVGGLAAFFLLFALSMFGVFEIGAGLMGMGGGGQAKSGLGGSFMSGCVATLVATPCTAPFMGSALGFALTQPAAVSMLVFTALGAGMATPYVVLTAFPTLLKVVPKPGAWMETFKQFLGFCLLATVVWLSGVFISLTSGAQVYWLLGSLLIFAVGAWILGRWTTPIRPKRTRMVGRVAALATVIVAGWALTVAAKPPVDHVAWEAWSPEVEAKALATGKPVFIDYTAEWCLTCKINEKVAFTQTVAQAFADNDVITLKADWTKKDEVTKESLARYGRSGIPLYVMYNKNGEYELLPDYPLFENHVLEAIEKVSK
jgi:thiol:disulfide interchange protein DsbD